jgi:subtilase family serine protease
MIDDEAFPGQIDYQRNVISEFSPSDLISLGILQNMDGLFTKKERTATVRLFGNVIGLRLGSIALGALMSLTSVTGSLAARVAALELSPMVATSTLLSTVDPEKQISVILSLPLSDSKGAAEFVQRVSNPKDPLYRQYITPNEFAERYGADAGDYATLREWAAANGLTIVHESVARTFLTVRGTAAQFQTLFKTQLNNYRSADGNEFYSASVEPTIPDPIAAKVTGVIGLTNSLQYAPLAKVHQVFGEDPIAPEIGTDTAGGTGPGGAYSPSDLRSVYKIPKFGDVAPQTVAVFEQNGFYPSDVQKYLERMQLPNRPVKFVGVNGYNGSVDRNNASVELQAVLDIELVIGINPGVKEVLVYEDGTDPFAVALIDALDKVASDNKAAILSISYGLDEVTQGDSQLAAENTALTQLAAQGITVLACSGNGGAYGQTGTSVYPAQLEVTDPGAQPLVTCVGATNLSTGPHEVRLAEAVWDRLGLFSGGGASGGGFSSYWTIPSWQAPSYVTTNGGSPTYRNVPDVAAVGDPFTGVAVYSRMNGGWLQMGGTGVSTPLWAGYISILNAGLEYVTGNRLGFFNPTFYNTDNIVNGPLLYSVIDGTNGDSSMYGTPGYNAGFGYNNCTGAGTIFGGGFGVQILSSESGGSPPGYSRVFDPTLTDRSAAFHWTKGKGATGHDFFECFVTKETNITFRDLLPKSQYHFSVYGVNKGGATWDGFLFTTK